VSVSISPPVEQPSLPDPADPAKAPQGCDRTSLYRWIKLARFREGFRLRPAHRRVDTRRSLRRG
jgi:hypothetical protein